MSLLNLAMIAETNNKLWFCRAVWDGQDLHSGASHQGSAVAAKYSSAGLHTLELGSWPLHQGLPTPVCRSRTRGGKAVADILPQTLGGDCQPNSSKGT